MAVADLLALAERTRPWPAGVGAQAQLAQALVQRVGLGQGDAGKIRRVHGGIGRPRQGLARALQAPDMRLRILRQAVAPRAQVNRLADVGQPEGGVALPLGMHQAQAGAPAVGLASGIAHQHAVLAIGAAGDPQLVVLPGGDVGVQHEHAVASRVCRVRVL